jgi:hypothetical protein
LDSHFFLEVAIDELDSSEATHWFLARSLA